MVGALGSRAVTRVLALAWQVDSRRVVEGGALSDVGDVYRWLGDTIAPADGSPADRDPGSHGLTFLRSSAASAAARARQRRVYRVATGDDTS